MSDDVALSLSTVEAAYRLFDDGIRRWRDLDIAEWLGLEQSRNIRQTIEANREELERHGNLHAVRANNSDDPRGRPATEYWLTFEQSLVICTQSRTPRAEDVRTVIIQVFSRVVNGGISTAPRMELRALEVAADRIVAPILKEQKEFQQLVLTRMDRQDGELSNVKHEVRELKKSVGTRRLDLTDKTRQIHVAVIEKYSFGRCPSCKEVLICQEGKKLKNAHDEHFYGASKRKLEHTWITCDLCNIKLNDPEFRKNKAAAFTAYQEWVTVHLKEIELARPRNLALPFGDTLLKTA